MTSKYDILEGIAHLGFDLSELERRLFRKFEKRLLDQGFRYLSLPSSLRWESLRAQETIPEDESLYIDDEHCLSGSAEQGILEYFAGKEVEPMFIYAENQCWRGEPEFIGLQTVKEFRKMEQYAFVKPDEARDRFDDILHNAYSFLEQFDELEVRIVDCTEEDPGYHHLKYDIEVMTSEYGWMETHSCSYFADEQTKRYDIEGGVHSISNTGIASPRILIPFIDAGIGADHPLLKGV